MKKILSLCIMAMVAMNMFAQKDVTTFFRNPCGWFRSSNEAKIASEGLYS